MIEERTIGPDLGKDSIRRASSPALSATVAVILFMIVTYGRFGIYATLALIVNAILILAGLAVFGSALTLPGIAGFVLTIGAAVDANVLINERIREEQRRGRRDPRCDRNRLQGSVDSHLRREHHERHRGGLDVVFRIRDRSAASRSS